MKKNEDQKRELESLSPFLSRLKQEQPDDGFSVPPAYFRKLQDEVLQRTAEQPKRKPWLQRADELLRRLFTPLHLAYATAILVLVTAGIWIIARQNQPDIDPHSYTAKVPAEELRTYVQNNMDAFTPEMILEVADDDAAFELSLTMDDLSEQEVDQLLDDLLKDMDEQALQDLL